MKADDAKWLKELESENARLKTLLADAELDKAMLKHLADGKKGGPEPPTPGLSGAGRPVRGIAATCLPDGGTALLYPTAGATDQVGRGRAVDGVAAGLLGTAARVGWRRAAK